MYAVGSYFTLVVISSAYFEHNSLVKPLMTLSLCLTFKLITAVLLGLIFRILMVNVKARMSTLQAKVQLAGAMTTG